MNNCTWNRACMRVIVLMALFIQAAGATELVYTPINPSFGGNPNNAAMLMNNANAQNTFKAPVLSAQEQFNKSLQAAISSRLLSQSIKTMFPVGTNGSLAAGTYDAGTFIVNVLDNGNGTLTVQTIDKSSGATATFDVSSGM